MINKAYEYENNINNFKKIFTIENLLCLFLILCPILDVASFLFRNYFNTSLSISTILRPIIPIFAIIYIFFKDKLKSKIAIAGIIYGLYSILHLYIFKGITTTCAYGNVIRELQYIINYTFMIMNLFIYLYIFIFRKNKYDRKRGVQKLRVAMLISLTVYIVLMYIAILTGTSSSTYTVDQMGYKGWFESGNSVGAIMILMLFAVLPMINKENNKKIRVLALIDVILAGIYLSTLLGTRVGLFGFGLVVFLYVICEILYSIYYNKKLNKKIVSLGVGIFFAITIVIVAFGSITISRRKLLQERESLIYDESLGESAHVTGDLLEIVNKIKDGAISEEYMSKPMQESIIDLYNYNNEHNIASTNMRMIQLVYHTALVKNQSDITLMLFGNGYMTHFRELIFEMEVPAFLYNFGIFGFILYFMPFFIIAVYGVCIAIKNIKKVNVKTIMSMLAICFAISVSFLSGYTFFNQSTVIMIITMCVITIHEIINMKGEKVGEDNIWNNKSNSRWSRKSSSRYSKQVGGKI